MQIRKLKNEFWYNNPNLLEAIDDKNRWYWVIICEYNNLLFWIPVRSWIKHSYCFQYWNSNRGKKWLDYTKALLLNSSQDLWESFFIPEIEKEKIIKNEIKIKKWFQKYIRDYISLTKKWFYQPRYRYSTLINYHKELNI